MCNNFKSNHCTKEYFDINIYIKIVFIINDGGQIIYSMFFNTVVIFFNYI